jgi:hypothetical protein
MPSIRALTAEAKAELFLREGKQAEASREYQFAFALWDEVSSPINAAAARLACAIVPSARHSSRQSHFSKPYCHFETGLAPTGHNLCPAL